MRFYAVAEAVERAAEFLERGRVVAAGGVAHALERAAEAYRGHGERSALRRWRAGVHVLYAARLCLGAAGVEVDLEVLDRFERGSQLQVLGQAGSGWRRYAVVVEQPAAFGSLVDVVVAYEAEREVEPGRHDVAAALAEHVADFGHEAWHVHAVLVAVGEADVAHEHQSARNALRSLVPLVLVKRGFGRDGELQRGGRVNLRGYAYIVVVNLLVLQAEGLAVLRLRAYYQAFALLAVRYGYGGVRHEGDFLLEAALVFGQHLLFLV